MKAKMKNWVFPILGLIVLAGIQFWQERQPSTSAGDIGGAGSGSAQLMAAYESQKSKVWVEVNGTVSKTLADDNKGSRHQRFIFKLTNGHTVLVAHNIDLASYVPLSKGKSVKIRGRYEWNDRGGVLHWTHHDPKGHIKGGWIEVDGKRYS